MSAAATATPYSTAFREQGWENFNKIVGDDIRKRASLADSYSLRMPETLVRWYRELDFIREDVSSQNAQYKAALAIHPLKPAFSETSVEGTKAWMPVLREYERLKLPRMTFLRACVARMQECRFLMRAETIPFDHTDMVVKLSGLARMLEKDDFDSAATRVDALLAGLEIPARD